MSHDYATPHKRRSLVGAFAATIASFVVNGLFIAAMDPKIVSYTINPVVEETLKIAFLLFVLFRTHQGSTFGISDGLLLGAALGAGFGCVEDTIRALAIGRAQMEWMFPQYALSNIPNAVLSWLPTGTAQRFHDGVSFHRAGDLQWTAFAATGAALFFRFRNSRTWAWFALFLPLIWATWDHATINLLSQHANILGDAYRPVGVVRQIHDFLARGWVFLYAFSAMVFIASIVDWWTIRSGLRNEQCAFLANASQKPGTPAADLLLTAHKTGRQVEFFARLIPFLRLRRRMAFAANAGALTTGLRIAVYRKHFFLNNILEDSERSHGSARLLPETNKLNIYAGAIKLAFLAIAAWFFVSFVIVFWYFLLSLYFASDWRFWFQRGPLFVACAATGFAMAIVTAIAFYVSKQVRRLRLEDRAEWYAEAVLVHTGLAMVGLPVLQLAGLPPFQKPGFLWGALTGLLKALGNAGPMFLGLVSLLADFSPAGNIKSGIEAITGVDPIARTQLGRAERLLAALGALPILGQGLKMSKAALQLGAGVMLLGAVKAGKLVAKAGGTARRISGTVDVARGSTRAVVDVLQVATASTGRVAKSRASFMNKALREINSAVRTHGGHPLSFLVDPKTSKWKARTHLVDDHPAVQAGHLVSRHSGAPERFATEDAWFNQVSNHVGETQGGVFFKQAVEIGGIPVEGRTAQMWYDLGLIDINDIRQIVGL